jgi:hypothetical protein
MSIYSMPDLVSRASFAMKLDCSKSVSRKSEASNIIVLGVGLLKVGDFVEVVLIVLLPVPDHVSNHWLRARDIIFPCSRKRIEELRKRDTHLVTCNLIMNIMNGVISIVGVTHRSKVEFNLIMPPSDD